MNVNKIQRTLRGTGSPVQHVLLAAFIFVSFSVILFLNYVPSQFMDLAVGQVSPRDIEAPRTYEVVNEQATNEARRKAMISVGTVFVPDLKVESEVLANVTRTFEVIRQIQMASGLNDKARLAQLRSQLPDTLGDASIKNLERVSPEGLEQLEVIAKDSLHQVLEKGVKADDLAVARKEVQERISRVAMPPELMAACIEVAQQAVRPNLVSDWEATNRLQREKSRSVEPIKTVVQKGYMVVRKGEIVTPEQMEILRIMGAGQNQFNLASLIGVMLFTLLCMFLCLIFMSQHAPELAELRKLWLVALILVPTAALCRWLVLEYSGYLAPVAAASMLISLLVDYRMALVATALLSIMVGVFTGEFSHCAVALLSGCAGVVSVAHVARRRDLVLASFFVCLVNTVAVVIFSLVKNEDLMQFGWDTLWGAGNGVLASVLATGALPFLENLFDIPTPMKLLDLSNPGEPLLRKLMEEAPGTYHHSVNVANLADAAARAVGANGLLARVGAYYHDIGKTRRSTFFVENQLGAENPHDKLTPTLSSMIITSHVKEGLLLAKEHKLPSAVADFIDMHHGTRLVQYFYHEARKVGGPVPEDAFRYGGRKPQNKETAIVMLADTIEAKARLLKKPDRESIASMVAETIRTIVGDGQLDDSTLSLRDLKIVAESFTDALLGIYHHRVEYPKDMLPINAGVADAAARAEQAEGGNGTAEEGPSGAPRGLPEVEKPPVS